MTNRFECERSGRSGMYRIIDRHRGITVDMTINRELARLEVSNLNSQQKHGDAEIRTYYGKVVATNKGKDDG